LRAAGIRPAAEHAHEAAGICDGVGDQHASDAAAHSHNR
jgi:hypothetical protein